jgi:O-antigen/teichoic acid export membrane protein
LILARLRQLGQHSLTKEFLFFAASTVALQGSRALVGVIAARELGPATWGLWYVLSLILAYGSLSQFGVLNAMNREVPLLLGKRRELDATRVRAVTYGILLLSSLLGALAIALSAYVVGTSVRISLVTLALLFVARQLLTFYQTDLKSRMLFGPLSAEQVSFAVAYPLIAIPMTYGWGLPGFIGAQAIVSAGICVTLAVTYSWKVRPALSLVESATLMRIGLLIMAVGLLFTLLTTVDRWVIGLFLDLEALGHYSLAIMVLTILSLLPLTVSQQIYPRMAHSYGNDGRLEAVRGWAIRQAVIAAALTLPIALVIYFAAPTIVAAWLPEYVAGVPAIQWILVGPIFLAVSGGYGNLLNVIDRQTVLLWVQGGSLITNLLMSWWLINAGWGITGVAIGTATSFALFGTAVVFLGLWITRNGTERTHVHP